MYLVTQIPGRPRQLTTVKYTTGNKVHLEDKIDINAIYEQNKKIKEI